MLIETDIIKKMAEGVALKPTSSQPRSDLQSAIDYLVETTLANIAAATYVVATASASLPNADVATDATAITWDKSVSNTIKPILGQFTGDVTNAAADSLALTIGSAKVTYAKIQNVGALSVFGRSANSAGVGADITGTDGQALRVSGTTLGFGTLATAAYADASVTYAKIANGTGLSIIGRSANSAGVNVDIVGTDGQALRVSGTALGFGTLATAAYADASVTYAKIQNVAGLSVVGRSANSSGVGADITGTDGQALRVSGTSLGFGTLATAAHADASVTYAKIQNIAGLSVMGRSANSSGVGADITGADGNVLRISGTSLGFGAIATAGITDAAVTYAKIQNVAGLSVFGRSANSSGVGADITGADKQILRVSGTTLGFGTIDLSSTSAVSNQLAAASVPALTGAVASAGGTLSTTATIDLVVVIGDGSNVLTTGAAGNWTSQFDFAATIVQWTVVAKQSGSVSIDVWKTTYTNFDSGGTHPVAADKISASAPITFSSATKAQDSTLTGWTKSIAAGDILAFNVASVTTCTQVVINIKLTKTT